MRFAFVLGGRVFFRFVDGVVRQLAADGHDVRVLVPNGTSPALERCAQECPGVGIAAYGEEPYFPQRLVTAARHLRGYRHWLEPEHRWGDFLRRRWATTEFGFPRSLRLAAKLLGLEGFDRLLRILPSRAALAAFERLVPPNPRVVRALSDLAPDLVVCTPFIYPSPRRHTTEVEYAKAARRLGIPTAVMVASWDNLSMKGIFYVEPDQVVVWNEIQRREARDLHHLPLDRVVATGAPVFDAWFERRFEMPRERFAAHSGITGEYLLYVESSAAAGDEWHTVHRFAEALDREDPQGVLRVMVRRHPSRRDAWPPLAHPRLALYPEESEVPDTEEARSEFFNSLCHARAVVGINTTVFVEAAILDRPCIAILEPEKDYFQAGLIHFHYLLDAGYLETAGSVEDAARIAREIAAGTDCKQTERRAFVRSFVRPADGSPASRCTAEALLEIPRHVAGARRKTQLNSPD